MATSFPTGGYTPDPGDSTQPTEDKLVVTAAAEFRGIKRRLNQSIPPGGGVGIPPGGLLGAVLSKISDNDYDAEWKTLSELIGEDGETLFPHNFEMFGSTGRSTPGVCAPYQWGQGADFDLSTGTYTLPQTGYYVFNATFVINPTSPVTKTTGYQVALEVLDAEGVSLGQFTKNLTVHPNMDGEQQVTERMGYQGILPGGTKVRCIVINPTAGQAGVYNPVIVRQFFGVMIGGGLGAGGGSSSSENLVQVACSDLATPLVAADIVGYFAAAVPMAIRRVRADLLTPSTTGDVELNVWLNTVGTSMLPEFLVIPEGELSAETTTLEAIAEDITLGDRIGVSVEVPGVGATGLLLTFSSREIAAPVVPPAPAPAPTPDPGTPTAIATAISYICANPQLFYKGEVVLTTGNKVARGSAVLPRDSIGSLAYVEHSFALTGIPLISTTSTVFFMPFSCDPDGECGANGWSNEGAAPKFNINAIAVDAGVTTDVQEFFPGGNGSDTGIKFASEDWGRNYGAQQREIYTESLGLDIKGINLARFYHEGQGTSTDAPTVLALPFTWAKVADSGAVGFTLDGGLQLIAETNATFSVLPNDLIIAWTVLAKHPVDAVPALDADLVYSWTRQLSNRDGQNYYGMSIWFSKATATYNISKAKAAYPGSRFVVFRKTAD